MPELPEVTLYLHALRPRILGERIDRIRIASPSLLKTFDPTPAELHGRAVETLSRLGKRIVLGLEDDIFAVIHLMIAGRFQWRKLGAAIPRKRGHAAFDFARGSLLLTEASTHKRASLHLVRGETALRAHDPGGIEPLEASAEDFAAAILRENRTLKRALTDPRILSGIGNAPLGRDPPAGAPVTRSAHPATERRRDRAPPRGHPVLAHRVVGAPDRGSGGRLPRQGDGLPPRHGRPRQVRGALRPVRHRHPAHRLRHPRDELLPGVPDRGTGARGPRPFEASRPGLAADGRGTGGTQADAGAGIMSRGRSLQANRVPGSCQAATPGACPRSATSRPASLRPSLRRR